MLVHVSGFGQTGPRAAEPGFGSIGEAMGGIRHTTGEPDRPPARTGVSIGDSLAGLFAVVGTLAALNERSRSGKGQEVDVAIYEAVMALMESTVADYELGGVTRMRSGGILRDVAPANAYPTSDGRDVVIAGNADAVFARLCEAMNRPDLARDLATHEARAERQDPLDEEIAAWTATMTADDLIALPARARRAGRPDQHRARSLDRSAHRGARHDRATRRGIRGRCPDDRCRAEVLAHPGRDPGRGARARRAHRRSAARSRALHRRGDRGVYETPALSRDCASKNSIGGSTLFNGGIDRGEQLLRLAVIVGGERARRRAELDHGPARVVGVDRRAPTVVDAHDVEAVLEPAVALGVELVERRVERDVVHEARQPEPGRDRGIEVGQVLVVEIPDREHLAVAGVVEQVAGPTVLHVRLGLDPDELEAHGLGVEAVGGLEVSAGDSDVVKSHGAILAPEQAS